MAFVAEDTGNHFRGNIRGRSVESDRGNGVSMEAPLGLPAQPWRRRLPALHPRFSSSFTRSMCERRELKRDLRPVEKHSPTHGDVQYCDLPGAPLFDFPGGPRFTF